MGRKRRKNNLNAIDPKLVGEVRPGRHALVVHHLDKTWGIVMFRTATHRSMIHTLNSRWVRATLICGPYRCSPEDYTSEFSCDTGNIVSFFDDDSELNAIKETMEEAFAAYQRDLEPVVTRYDTFVRLIGGRTA